MYLDGCNLCSYAEYKLTREAPRWIHCKHCNPLSIIIIGVIGISIIMWDWL